MTGQKLLSLQDLFYNLYKNMIMNSPGRSMLLLCQSLPILEKEETFIQGRSLGTSLSSKKRTFIFDGLQVSCSVYKGFYKSPLSTSVGTCTEHILRKQSNTIASATAQKEGKTEKSTEHHRGLSGQRCLRDSYFKKQSWQLLDFCYQEGLNVPYLA